MIAKKLKYLTLETLSELKTDFIKCLFKTYCKKILSKISDGDPCSKFEVISNFNILPKLIDFRNDKNDNNDKDCFSKTSSEEFSNIISKSEEKSEDNFDVKLGDFFKKNKSSYNINLEIYKNLLKEIEANNCLFPLHEQILFWFPEYLIRYKNTISTLMDDDSYLPRVWKYFIAIMAVSTIKCEYMVKSLEESFLAEGGKIEWLVHGIKVVPEKLQMLGKINNILAHQPWKLSFVDFNTLLFKSDIETTYWNLNELTLAFFILITYQKIATIYKSSGLKTKMEEPIDINNIIKGNN